MFCCQLEIVHTRYRSHAQSPTPNALTVHRSRRMDAPKPPKRCKQVHLNKTFYLSVLSINYSGLATSSFLRKPGTLSLPNTLAILILSSLHNPTVLGRPNPPNARL